MGHAYVGGQFWFIAMGDRAAARVTVNDTGGYLTAAVVIGNWPDNSVDVVPSQFQLILVPGAKAPKHLKLDYVPPERAIGNIYRTLNWSQLGDGIAAMSATRTETTRADVSGTVDLQDNNGGHATGTFDGTATTTRQVPDEQRLAQIQAARQQREQAAQANVATVSATALQATTLAPGQEIHGVVFFKGARSCRGKSGCTLQFFMPVGDTTFEFPVIFKRQ